MSWFDRLMPPTTFLDPTNVEDLIWSFGSIPVDPDEALSPLHHWGSLAYGATFLL